VSGTGALGGTGFIDGPVAVAGGATLAPGASIGTLTVNNNVTLGGVLAIEIDGSTSDLLAVANLDLSAATDSLTFTQLAAPAASTYTLATYTGVLTGAFNSVNSLPSGYTIDYGSGTNSAILLVAVPEPAASGLVAVGASSLLMRRRRRR
jgi:hypothetical protein